MKKSYLVIYITCFCLAQTLSAEKYYFSRRIRIIEDIDLTVYVFDTILEKGLDHCIQTCKTKKKCKFINYHVLAHACFLIGVTDEENFILGSSVEKTKGYIFGNKSEWNMDEYSPCEGCSDNGECSIDQKCGNSGCPLPEKTPERAVLHGNMFSVGSKISYQCYEGYAMNSTDISISTCEADGAWSLTSFKCLPEVVFTADVLRSDDTYYKLVRNKYTWDEAKSNCECLGGYLADIKSQQEQDVIEKLVSGISRRVWIGGKSKQNLVNTFVWLDGSVVNSGYVNWKSGQPYHPDGGIRCMDMVRDWNYQWNDVDCSNKFASVCEFR